MGIYDSDSRNLPELIAGIYHFHRFVEPLDVDHTLPLGPRLAASLGYPAALILGGDLYGRFELEAVPIALVTTRVLAVVPITASEWQMKRNEGIGRLLKLWHTQGKDYLHLETR